MTSGGSILPTLTLALGVWLGWSLHPGQVEPRPVVIWHEAPTPHVEAQAVPSVGSGPAPRGVIEERSLRMFP